MFDSMTVDQLCFSPGPDKWNLLQVALHVMTSERLSVIYINRKTGAGSKISPSGLKSKLRLLALWVALKLPIKFKAPESADVTKKDVEYARLKSDWQKIRTELKSLIEDLDEATLKGEVFRHPRVGMINMKQALKFMGIHIDHHKKQMDRIMNQADFPTGE